MRKNSLRMFRFTDFFDNTRTIKRASGTHVPLRLIKNTFVTNNQKFDPQFSDTFELFRFRFNDNNISLKHRPNNNNNYLTLKQKRYNLRQKISAKIKTKFNPATDKVDKLI
jgi:hypothetical protein